MMLRTSLRGALLACTALGSTAALAQSATTASPVGSGAPTSPQSTPSRPGGTTGEPGGAVQDAAAPEPEVEISAPGASGAEGGGEIVVTGRNIPNSIRATPQVLSVLSSAEIARTGDGDIAGALTRVTGLSVVGNGFVFVRGLGDRYSSALLNGLPMPSPEPLRRTVPLDLFPTSVIASAVVQKSYSANYPGEFGGGVINLTTPSVPKEGFFNFGVSGTYDTQTTNQNGYTYYGSRLDYLGFDTGVRDVPRGLAAAIKSGNPVVSGSNFTPADLRGFAASLTNAPTTLLQTNQQVPPNFSAELSAGQGWDIGSDGRIGFVASASFGNTWRTRDARQQASNDPGLGALSRDFRTVITDNRAVTSALVSGGLELGRNKLRLTGLYIRDTNKQGRLSKGYNTNVPNADPIANPNFTGITPIVQQNTYWFERQLIDGQAVAELHFGDLAIDLRGGYANSQRESPYEREFTYTYDASTARDYVNFLARRGGQSASVAFSDLNEDVYAGGADFSYKLPFGRDTRVTAGYAYNKTERTSSRFLFDYVAAGGAGVPIEVAQERPDYLVSDFNVYTYDLRLSDASGAQGTAAYEAELETNAGYGQIDAELIQGLRVNAGVRYEKGKQSVVPRGSFGATRLNNNYWLPAGTVTWNFAEDMQVRVAASKTIARPQFRELAQQVFQDFESDRQFQGNPFLTDSTLKNAEARFEWYFAREQRVSVAGFFKRIDNPIEQVGFFAGGGALRTGFANAPKADLYGAEAELVKFIPLDTVGVDFFDTRRVLVSANYTYTKSELKIGSQTIVGPDLSLVPANVLYQQGAPLTGQSDHIVNLQLGLESTGRLSQQTILLNYASKRVTNRGPIQGSGRQPDIFEKPGFTLDFVAREEVPIAGKAIELKFEARNLAGRKFQEFQTIGGIRVDINKYKLGRLFSVGGTLKF